MPDIVTHATFAMDVIKKIEDKTIKEIIQKNKYIYYLGAQGPDVFYFQGHIKTLGNQMHDYHVDEFLLRSFSYLYLHQNEQLLSYLIGFICHHALDRIAHPYVYYVTGKYNPKDPNTYQYRGNHMRLERAIDSIFIKERWDCDKPHTFKINKKVLNYRLNKSTFTSFYNELLSIYDIDSGGSLFLKAAKSFKSYTKLLYDPFGIKKKLARFVDQRFNKKSKLVFETMFHYHNINEEIDYLNLNQNKWSNPCVEEYSTKSFWDLYDEAISQAVTEINLLIKYLNSEENEDVLKNIIKDLSYSTGKSWTKHLILNMKYFNVIF